MDELVSVQVFEILCKNVDGGRLERSSGGWCWEGGRFGQCETKVGAMSGSLSSGSIVAGACSILEAVATGDLIVKNLG